jgi:hypothetical protein
MSSYIDLTDEDLEFGVEVPAEIQPIDLTHEPQVRLPVRDSGYTAEEIKRWKERVIWMIQRQWRWDVEAYHHQLRLLDLYWDTHVERQKKEMPLTRPQ